MAGLIDLNGLGHFKAKENAMVADTYSASKTYAVGDYVYYNGTLYRCTTAISTTEAWTAGHWTAVKLADDCSALKTAIASVARVEETTYNKITTQDDLITIDNGLKGSPAYSLLSDIEYNSNGISSLILRHRGENWLDKTVLASTSSVSVSQGFTGVNLSSNSSGTYQGVRIPLTHLIPGVEYTLSAHAKVSSGSAMLALRNSSTQAIIKSSSRISSGEADLSFAFTLTDRTSAYLILFVTWSTKTTGSVAYSNLQITMGDNSANIPEYQHYNGHNYEYNFEETIYGGEIDFINGILTSKYDSNGELLSPAVTYKVQSIHPTLLDGVNSFWTETGKVTLEYGDYNNYLAKSIPDSEIALGENLIPYEYFESVYGGITISWNDIEKSLTITSTNNTRYSCFSTGHSNGNFMNNLLEEGKTYRMHCKADVISGTPYICMAVRGRSANDTDGIAVSVTPNDGEEIYVDFTASQYMKYVSLFVSGSSSADGSTVKYSDFWIKEILGISGIDYSARNELAEFALETKYNAEMIKTVNSVFSYTKEPCLVFPLITDIHYYSDDNQKGVNQFFDTVKNLAYFYKQIHCDGLLCLGDMTDGGYDSGTPKYVSMGKVALKKIFSKLRDADMPIFFTLGNHDDFRYVESYMKADDIYSYYYQQCDTDVIFNTSNRGTDFYRDFVGQKVRLISVNTNILPTNSSAGAYGIANSTVTWITSVLNDMPEGYIALLITHAPIYRDLLWESGTAIPNVASLQNAINSSGKTVIALAGHTHFTANFFPRNGFLNICTGPEKVDGPTEDSTIETYGGLTGYRYARDMATATAELWDVVVLRPLSNKLIMVRFGAGVDRLYNYTPIALSASEELTSELTGELTWASSDTSIATVSSGTVTPVATGRAFITATDTDGNEELWWVDVT